jgi:hypothetical protein
MIVSVKNGEFFKIYINGELWLDAPVVQDIDARYGLQPTLLIFQDDDGDDGTILCSEIGIWDVALTQGEATGLGNASTSTVSAIPTIESHSNATLGQNYPNPFTVSTTFPYQVTKTGNVVFRILDVRGKEVGVINEGSRVPGDYELVLQHGNLNAGVYYVQMITSGEVSTRKMVVSK